MVPNGIVIDGTKIPIMTTYIAQKIEAGLISYASSTDKFRKVKTIPFNGI